MTTAIYILILVAGALIIWGVFKPARRGFKLDVAHETQQQKKLKMRSYLSRIFPFSQNLLEKFQLNIRIKNKLDAAHIHLTALEYFNVKLAVIILMVILSFFALGKVGPVVILVAVALGYIAPDILVNRKISQRKYSIARMLPETVDLLGLCVEAGLDFTTSVKWVIEKVPKNPIIEELAFVLEEIKWGKPRTQALKDMAKRLNIPEVSSFVQTLVQAERMGTPVAEAFTILSEDTRLQRFHRGERFAMQAPIKILIPLIFCILPVIAIVVGGPIFLQFTQGGLLKGLGN